MIKATLVTPKSDFEASSKKTWVLGVGPRRPFSNPQFSTNLNHLRFYFSQLSAASGASLGVIECPFEHEPLFSPTSVEMCAGLECPFAVLHPIHDPSFALVLPAATPAARSDDHQDAAIAPHRLRGSSVIKNGGLRCQYAVESTTGETPVFSFVRHFLLCRLCRSCTFVGHEHSCCGHLKCLLIHPSADLQCFPSLLSSKPPASGCGAWSTSTTSSALCTSASGSERTF